MVIDYREVLISESERFAELVEAGSVHERVPGCPEWTVSDLVAHLGWVQRWGATIVATGAPVDGDYSPDGRDLDVWFREGTMHLLAALDQASPTDECVTGEIGGRGTVAFWHRRQALEVAVHRFDVEQATIGLSSPIEASVAADIVDELIDFRIRRQVAGEGVDLAALRGAVHLSCSDVRGEWTVDLADGELVVANERRDAAVSAAGNASDLALFLHRRVTDQNVEILGDRALLDRWIALAW